MIKFNLIIKRFIDILGSGIGITLLSPLFLIIALLIKFKMPGPIFFKQERIGKNKIGFYILKFRTMKVDAAAEREMDHTKDYQRITGLGKLLRRTKIDELPQLLNVFQGDMSLVGPRPTVESQVKKYTEAQVGRLSMKPGMTGLAQVNGNTSLDWNERIKYDLAYVKSFSILLDIKILIKTIGIVVFGEEKFRRKES